MIITQTPLRISFFGGGSDFPNYYLKQGGGVIGSTINKYIYVIVKKRFDKYIYVNYSKKEIVRSIDKLEHELVKEALRKVGIKDSIEISFLADIPSQGSGLGSSGSVLVGTLNALYHYIGEIPTKRQLAETACEIEIDILKKPVGVQDQFFAAFGGLLYMKFNNNGKIDVNKVNVSDQTKDDLDNSLMLFYTGKTRKSASILSEQKNNISSKENVLEAMVNQVIKAKNMLETGEVYKLGQLLGEAWEYKQKLASKISSPLIHKMYNRAIINGAIGGKILGAGGGGFLLLSVADEKRQHIRKALKTHTEMPFRLESYGSKVILNNEI